MSGGARMVRCRYKGARITATPKSGVAPCIAGTAIAGAAERQALRHFAWSMPSPQQSSAGADMLMLSHGLSADCAHALAVSPNASQKASNAAMSRLGVKGLTG